MDDFKEAFSHFNVYDFLNPIISGFYMIAGMFLIIGPDYWKKLLQGWDEYLKNDLINAALLLTAAYLTGIALEWVSHILFSSRRRKLIENCLLKPNQEAENGQVVGTQRSVRMQSAFKKCFPDRLEINSLKYRLYINDADKVIKSKTGENYNPGNSEHNTYYMAYCEYTNQIRGISAKTEILREVWGLSRELCIASFLMFLLLLFRIGLSWGGIRFQYEYNPWIMLIIFGGLAIVFLLRADLALRNRLQMVLALHHASTRLFEEEK